MLSSLCRFKRYFCWFDPRIFFLFACSVLLLILFFQYLSFSSSAQKSPKANLQIPWASSSDISSEDAYPMRPLPQNGAFHRRSPRMPKYSDTILHTYSCRKLYGSMIFQSVQKIYFRIFSFPISFLQFFVFIPLRQIQFPISL